MLETKTIYYVFYIKANFPNTNETHTFYFKHHSSAVKARDLILENSSKIGVDDKAYCFNVTKPGVKTIEKDQISELRVYQSIKDFIKNDAVYQDCYGNISAEKEEDFNV